MAEISADSLSELESYGQGKQYIYILTILHAGLPFGHLLDNSYCLFVQLLVATAACNFNIFYLAVLLYDESDDCPALYSRFTAFLWIAYLVLQKLH